MPWCDFHPFIFYHRLICTWFAGVLESLPAIVHPGQVAFMWFVVQKNATEEHSNVIFSWGCQLTKFRIRNVGKWGKVFPLLTFLLSWSWDSHTPSLMIILNKKSNEKDRKSMLWGISSNFYQKRDDRRLTWSLNHYWTSCFTSDFIFFAVCDLLKRMLPPPCGVYESLHKHSNSKYPN